MYISRKEVEALNAAWDCISNLSDGVDDVEYWSDLCETIGGIVEKAIKDVRKREDRQLVDSAVRSAMRKLAANK